MRAPLVSLIALGLAAPAVFAQTTPTPPTPVAPAAAPTTNAPVASAPTQTAPASTAPPATAPSTASTPMTPTPTTAPPAAAAPAPAPSTASTPTTAPPAAAASPTEVAAAPPVPPPAPTDPTAIAVIGTIESVCAPAVVGGNLDKLSKSAGYRKSGDNYVMRKGNFQLTVLAAGSNPTTCHIDILSPVDPEAPAKPLVVALHNWAAVTRGYSLYRNDKNVAGSQELTTRSWELTENGKNSALVLTTFRKADGTPSGSRETSQVLFSIIPAPAS